MSLDQRLASIVLALPEWLLKFGEQFMAALFDAHLDQVLAVLAPA